MTIKTEPRMITFRALDPNYRLVRIPERQRYNQRGELEIIPGERYEFRHGELKVEPDNDDVLNWLRQHEKFNVKFVEVGNEPDRVLPSVEDVVGQITDAAVAADANALISIYEQEKSTHAREVVLNACQHALERLEVKAVQEGANAPED